MTSPSGSPRSTGAGPAGGCSAARGPAGPVAGCALLAVLIALAGCGGGTDRAMPGPARPSAGAPNGVLSARAVAAATLAAQTLPETPPGPRPSGAAATAGLIADFPTDLLPLPPGATVTASAARVDGDVLEVSLSGTTSFRVADVVAFYDKAFRAFGFDVREGSTFAPGTGGRVYGRADQLVVLAVTEAGGARSFSVGGTLAR